MTQTKSLERNFTIAKASQELGVPIGTLRKHRAEIGGAKLGRLWIFTESELLNWMEFRRRSPVR